MFFRNARFILSCALPGLGNGFVEVVGMMDLRVMGSSGVHGVVHELPAQVWKLRRLLQQHSGRSKVF